MPKGTQQNTTKSLPGTPTTVPAQLAQKKKSKTKQQPQTPSYMLFCCRAVADYLAAGAEK